MAININQKSSDIALIALPASSAATPLKAKGLLSRFGQTVKSGELIFFFSQLSLMIDIGMSLKNALENMLDQTENAAFKAENPHELCRCLEVRSVIENAEMILRASVERKESRRIPFGFYRADYPESNDKDYFVFLGQRQDGDNVVFKKIEIKG